MSNAVNSVISIGTNMGNREQNIENAVKALGLLPGTQVLKCSSIIETEPVGYTDQPDFFNCCVLLKTSLSPKALLGCCLGIEAAMGRIREFTNGPRIIDLDIITYGDTVHSDSELTLPHPRAHERDFVKIPLKELQNNK